MLGGWVRAVENHGVRSLPFRIKSKYSPEGERYQDAARFTSVYFDAPVKTKVEVEQALALNEHILRSTFLRPKSVIDEVRTTFLFHKKLPGNHILSLLDFCD